ncbi:MAG: PQQ-dependent catabolism-associated beta-propeller protein [Legionellales bacterium]|nr:PQQ-dependent catabolism-associated beta-propeller protein [Legionellales bacterium]
MKLYLVPLIFFAFFYNQVNACPTGRIFITNERGDTVSVINGDSLVVEATIDVGDRPRGIGISPDGSEIYIAVSEENKIKVMDPVSLKIIREFNAGSDPETFAVHPNGNIYISNEDDAKASVFDPKTGEQLAEISVGLEPEGVAISADGKRVIVTSESTNMLHVIRASDNTIEKNILVGARPRAATFTKSGDIAYATAEISGEVVKIDMNTGEILKRGSSGDNKSKPKDVVLNKDESVVYVAAGRANKVVAMDAQTLEIITSIPVGKRVWGLAISKNGELLFSTDGVSGTVSVIKTSTNEVIKTIKVGEFPWGVIIND